MPNDIMPPKNIALPKDFEQHTQRLFGYDRYNVFKDALQHTPQTTIRLNPFKRLADGKPTCSTVDWCSEGRVLDSRPDFTFDPLLHAGVYYVQESSSMFIDHVVRQLVDTPVLALDLCAAPGGKTTTLRAALPKGSIVVANEPMKVRASILAENVQKQGHPDIMVTNNYPRDFRKAKLMFDIILADVPCSGEGMFRKDPQAIGEWSAQNVERCADLQRSIIEDIWPTLRPGGLLVYSTCTYNEHEDEENICWIMRHLGASLVKVAVDPHWHITDALATPLAEKQVNADCATPDYNAVHDHNTPADTRHAVCRFIPGFTPGEGIFMAVLQKPCNQQGEEKETKKKKDRQKDTHTKSNVYAKAAEQWLKADPQNIKSTWTVVEMPTAVRAIPTRWLPLYEDATRALHVIHAGVTLGTPKGKQLVPAAGLALSTALCREAFTQVAIGWQQAIQYLRKEAITLPANTPQGFVLLTYRGHALGFCKNVGNRANNLYPQEWKIKTTHLPEQPICALPAQSASVQPKQTADEQQEQNTSTL